MAAAPPCALPAACHNRVAPAPPGPLAAYTTAPSSLFWRLLSASRAHRLAIRPACIAWIRLAAVWHSSWASIHSGSPMRGVEASPGEKAEQGVVSLSPPPPVSLTLVATTVAAASRALPWATSLRAVLAARIRFTPASSPSRASTRDRSSLATGAERFICNVNTYGPELGVRCGAEGGGEERQAKVASQDGRSWAGETG